MKTNLRLFVAIYPPREVVQQCFDALSNVSLPPHRVTPIEQVHLTAQFIGDTPAAKLDETIESVERSVAGLQPFQLQPLRLITLPERGPARLIAAELDAHPTLLEIHRRLALRLARNLRPQQRERFYPHMTLCRFRSPAKGVTMNAALTADKFTVDRVNLMRSALSHAGATHHELAESALTPPPGRAGD